MLKRNIYEFSTKILHLEALKESVDTYVDSLVSFLDEFYPIDESWSKHIKIKKKENSEHGFSLKFGTSTAGFLSNKKGYKNIELVLLLAESFGMLKDKEIKIDSSTLTMEKYALLKENPYNATFLITSIITGISSSPLHNLYSEATEIKECLKNGIVDIDVAMDKHPNIKRLLSECLGLIRLSEKFSDRLNQSELFIIDDTLKNIRTQVSKIEGKIENIGF